MLFKKNHQIVADDTSLNFKEGSGILLTVVDDPQLDQLNVTIANGGSLPAANLVNVTDPAYGAVGNGIADDIAAINLAYAAVPSGGILVFPAGKTFGLGSPWNPTRDNITVLAYGATFKPLAGVSGRIQIGDSTHLVNNFRWFGGDYDGAGGSNFCFAMSAFFGTGCHVEDYGFSGLAAAVGAEGIIVSGDGRIVSDAATTAGSTTITSAGAAFTSADIGKVVIVWTAGADGCAFESRITALIDASNVTVAIPVWKTVSGARMNIATMQDAVFKGLRGKDAGGDSFRANENACGVKLVDSIFQNSNTSLLTRGGVMSNGAPFVVAENVSVDGSGGYGIRFLGYKNKGIVSRVRNWPSSNDGFRLAEEGCELIAPEAQDSKDGGGSGYGIRLTNDSGLSTSPIGMKVKGGNVRSCGGVKIDFFGPNGAAPQRCEVDTTVEGCSQDGVFVTHGSFHRIRGTVCNNVRDGVHLTNVTDIDVDITAFDSQGAKTQVYGVRSDGTSDRTRVRGRIRADDHVTGALSLVGTANDLGYSPRSLRVSAKGFLAETFDPAAGSGALAAPCAIGASTTLVGTLLDGVHAGETVTKMAVFVGSVGSGASLTKLALFSKTGTLLGVTADLTASLVANSYLVGSLGTPYVVATEDAFFGAILIVSSVTAPTILRGTSLTGIGVSANSGVRPAFTVATQSDITGNVALANASTAWWFAAA